MPKQKLQILCEQIIGRPAYQRGQLSVKQPLLALQVQVLPDLPPLESNPIGRSALFAKQMEFNACGSIPLLSAF
jgi:hypothetical protein